MNLEGRKMSRIMVVLVLAFGIVGRSMETPSEAAPALARDTGGRAKAATDRL